MIIGITGGTGAGKTTALNAIKSLDGYVVDCDAVYHELLNDSENMKNAINARFPGVVTGGAIDRHRLGEIVFSSPAALSDLNAITHPYVVSETMRRIEEQRRSGREIFAIDAIGLFECGISDYCDVTVFVTAPKEERAKRIMLREGISLEYAMLRIDAQKSDAFFKEKCTYTLNNNFDNEKSFGEYCTGFFKNIIRRDKNG